MKRALLPIAFALVLSGPQARATPPLQESVSGLKGEAIIAFAKISSDRPKVAGNEKASAELWDRKSYWTHFLDLVLELQDELPRAQSSFKQRLNERLAASRRTLRASGTKVEFSPDGNVILRPEPSSYSDRENALKSAADISVYSRLTD